MSARGSYFKAVVRALERLNLVSGKSSMRKASKRLTRKDGRRGRAEAELALETILTTLELDLKRYGRFDPRSVRDTRDRIAAYIVARPGQREFRRKLIKIYGRRCAVTGCDAGESLEAAHIIPYRGRQTNDPSNGLLLRADVHILFDLGLIAVETKTMRIVLAPEIENTAYRELKGKKLLLPDSILNVPNKNALDEHLKTLFKGRSGRDGKTRGTRPVP